MSRPLCHVPNDAQKISWNRVTQDFGGIAGYGDGIDWIYQILEDDCFPDKARGIRDRDSN